MADVISFNAFRDPSEMDRQQLLAYLDSLRAQVAELDAAEPADMESEEYEDWGDRHEELEDRIDEVFDLLDRT